MSGQGGCRRRLRSDRGSTVGGAASFVAPFGQIRSPAGAASGAPIASTAGVASRCRDLAVLDQGGALRAPRADTCAASGLGRPAGTHRPSRQSPAADHVRLIRQASGAARCRLPGAGAFRGKFRMNRTSRSVPGRRADRSGRTGRDPHRHRVHGHCRLDEPGRAVDGVIVAGDVVYNGIHPYLGRPARTADAVDRCAQQARWRTASYL